MKSESFHVRLAAGRTLMTPLAPQLVYRPAGMDGWILNCTVSGKGRLNPGADVFRAGVGEMLLFPPNVIHDYGHDPSAGHWEHLWVYFFPRPHWSEWLRWPLRSPGIGCLSVSDGATLERIQKRFVEVIEVSRGPGTRSYEFAMNALEEILLLCDAVNPEQAQTVLDERVQRAMEYICDNLDQPLSVESVARACNLSGSRLSHLFKEHMQTSVIAYAEEMRVRRARELLLMTARPVGEISAELGFSSPFYFTRVFRKCVGVSPRDFRRQAMSGRERWGK